MNVEEVADAVEAYFEQDRHKGQIKATLDYLRQEIFEAQSGTFLCYYSPGLEEGMSPEDADEIIEEGFLSALCEMRDDALDEHDSGLVLYEAWQALTELTAKQAETAVVG